MADGDTCHKETKQNVVKNKRRTSDGVEMMRGCFWTWTCSVSLRKSGPGLNDSWTSGALGISLELMCLYALSLLVNGKSPFLRVSSRNFTGLCEGTSPMKSLLSKWITQPLPCKLQTWETWVHEDQGAYKIRKRIRRKSMSTCHHRP